MTQPINAIDFITREIDKVDTAIVWLQENTYASSRAIIKKATHESEVLYDIRAKLVMAQRNHDDNRHINRIINNVVSSVTSTPTVTAR